MNFYEWFGKLKVGKVHVNPLDAGFYQVIVVRERWEMDGRHIYSHIYVVTAQRYTHLHSVLVRYGVVKADYYINI